MQMRIVWGRILPGKWDEFEATFKRAMAMRGEIKGLHNQWLVRDQNDLDAGFSISLFEGPAAADAWWQSETRVQAMALLQPFYVNQYTVTNCDVRFAVGG
jgi:heme-degrading monooxygenase HmoA